MITHPLNSPPVLVAISRRGLALAESLRRPLSDCRIHLYRPRLGEGAEDSFDDVAAHLRTLFCHRCPIVGVFSTGIIIRALDGCLRDKHDESPVIALAEDGSCVVPLLGAHRGGLELARTIAAATGGLVAATTASDVASIPALDRPPPGWRYRRNHPGFKNVMADLLNGAPVALCREIGDGGWLAHSGLSFSPTGKRRLIVTHRCRPLDTDEAVLHPPVLAVGVGCERGIDSAGIIALIEKCLARHNLAREAIACLCSVDIKMNEAAIHDAAAHFACPARFFESERLHKETPRLINPSAQVYHATGCYGVAEGAALATVGKKGRLLCEKTVGQRSTCAIALAPAPLDVTAIGQGRGHLSVVGLGPGNADGITIQGRKILGAAHDIVGYRFYLDQAAFWAPQAQRHDFPLGKEIQRVEHALELAATGRQVALISSGDAGIYGMAALVFERRHLNEKYQKNGGPEISVLPGVTAMQAAAARIGAPLGHDFCAISLSDLMTPWPVIRTRLEAAAQGDFVVALYNPVSQRRQTQIIKARDIFRRRRKDDTPVILARNLGRAGETMRITELGKLSADNLDMLSVVLIGNSQTRRDQNGALYTPRGYGDPNSPPLPRIPSRTPPNPKRADP